MRYTVKKIFPLILFLMIDNPGQAQGCVQHVFSCATLSNICYIYACRDLSGNPTLFQEKWCDGWFQYINYVTGEAYAKKLKSCTDGGGSGPGGIPDPTDDHGLIAGID